MTTTYAEPSMIDGQTEIPGTDPADTDPAPYGRKADGTPRKSRGGRPPGRRNNTTTTTTRARSTGRAANRGPSASLKAKADQRRREALLGLVDSFVVMPLAGLSVSGTLERRFGNRQTDALAADALVLHAYAPQAVEALIVLSQSKPNALAWLDRVEDNAPYVLLAAVGIQMARALAENHLNPDARAAAAGRQLAAVKTTQMIAEIQRQAAELGVPEFDPRDYDAEDRARTAGTDPGNPYDPARV